MHLQARERTLIGMMVIVLCALAIWRFALESLWNRYLQAADTVHTMSAKVETARETVDAQSNLQVGQQALAQALRLLQVPADNADIGAISTQRLYNLTRGLDLRLYEVKPQKPVKAAPFSLIPLTVRGEGTFAAVVAFLARLQNDQPALMATRLDLGSKAGMPARLDFTIDISAMTYIGSEVAKK